MSLQIDNFAVAVHASAAQGWVVLEYTRYDPTHIVGLTPTGKAFTLDAVGNTVTVTVAGYSASRTILKENWLQGDRLWQALNLVWNDLPVSQR